MWWRFHGREADAEASARSIRSDFACLAAVALVTALSSGAFPARSAGKGRAAARRDGRLRL
jgi:hypothetical protein